MDGLSEFSVLALFGYLSKQSSLLKDHSWVSIFKFYLTLLVSVLATAALWGLIGYIGSMIYIPLRLDMAVLFTLTGVAVSFGVLLTLVAHGVESVDQHIRSALKAHHIQHEADKPRKLLPH